MSVYFVKRKGWRYDFTHKGTRYTETWFETKKAAKEAEADKRKELKNPALEPEPETQTDMAFSEFVNLRLDHVKAYNTESHYRDICYHARRWVKNWQGLNCNEINTHSIEMHLQKRLKVSAHVANKELQYVRALFNFGIRKQLVKTNPTVGIDFFPIEKRKKYIPPKDDVLKVISAGNIEEQQYLWTIVLTAGRVSEINGLVWDDVDFKKKLITLWTRKRKGGNREPREVSMISKLYEILCHRYQVRDPEIPYVFWHTYWSRKQNGWGMGPYGDRKKLMETLCKKAGVKYFRFHALRHLTASILDDLGVPIGVIQRILGHQNRKTTEIYLHSIGEAEREAMTKLESIDVLSFDFKPDPDKPTNMPLAFWNRKVERPTYNTLKQDIKMNGYSRTGRKYGVSDNTIRKWIRSYENQVVK